VCLQVYFARELHQRRHIALKVLYKVIITSPAIIRLVSSASPSDECLPLDLSHQSSLTSPKAFSMLKREVLIQMHLRHPNILRLRESRDP
jgi:predicted acetyltransferase